MISADELYALAKCRFDECKILRDKGKPDGAVYLCGYSLELILKRHIVMTLNWDGFPDTTSEFKNLLSFKTHNLDVLLSLAGLEKQIREDDEIFAYWQRASTWNSEIRYKKVGDITQSQAVDIIEATRFLLNYIYPLRI